MRKYKLIQEYGVMEEDVTPIKEFGVHLLLKVEGIQEHRVLKMLAQFSDGFSDLMQEETSEIENEFAALNEKLMTESESAGKRWFK